LPQRLKDTKNTKKQFKPELKKHKHYRMQITENKEVRNGY